MTTTRTGRVMLRAGWVGDRWEYRSVAVQEEADGSLCYYLGGPTCNTSDGWVSLPEEHRPEICWDAECHRPAPASVDDVRTGDGGTSRPRAV